MLFVLNIYPHIYKINLLHNYSHFVNCFSFTLLCTHFFFLSHGVPILMTSLYMYLPPRRCLHLFLNKVPAPFPLNWEGDLSSFPNNIYRYAPSRLLFFFSLSLSLSPPPPHTHANNIYIHREKTQGPNFYITDLTVI